jgi:hypothetical protein
MQSRSSHRIRTVASTILRGPRFSRWCRHSKRSFRSFLLYSEDDAREDLGAEFGANIFVLWGGREGVETDGCRRPDEAIKRLREALNYIYMNTRRHSTMVTSSRS